MQYARTILKRPVKLTGFGQTKETGMSCWSPQPSTLRRDNLMELRLVLTESSTCDGQSMN